MLRRISLLVLLLVPMAWAQTTDDLRRSFQKMLVAMDKLDFETMVDFTYPQLVTMAGRESLLKEIRQPFEDPAIKLSFLADEGQPRYSQIQDIDNRKFCVIQRQTSIRIAFTENLPAEASASILQNMQRSAPMRKVTFKKSENSFYSIGPEVTIAIADELTKKQWRFLTYEPSQRPLMKQFFGEKALQQLKLADR
jgi:hypothetical protein